MVGIVAEAELGTSVLTGAGQAKLALALEEQETVGRLASGEARGP